MKNLILSLMAFALVGCESTIYPSEVKAADEACRPFGGVRSFTASSGNLSTTNRPMVTASCVDGTIITHRLSFQSTVELP